MSHVAIVLVNWNGKDNTRECLQSLNKLKTSGIQITILVVDNASTDGSIEMIQTKFPKVTLIKATENLGFTGGNNKAINFALESGVNSVWLLNNDTFVHPESLSILLDALHSGVGIVGPKIYFAPGYEYHKDRYEARQKGHILWYAGGNIDWDNMYAYHRGVDEVDHGQFDEQGETQFVTGCSMLIAREVFKKIGIFDERYFLYLEDLDFCIRANHEGFKIVYVPAAKIWHKNAGSTDRPGNALHQYYFTRNRLLLGMRYAPLRTKIALIREAVSDFAFGESIKRKAIGDAACFKFGNQFSWRN